MSAQKNQMRPPHPLFKLATDGSGQPKRALLEDRSSHAVEESPREQAVATGAGASLSTGEASVQQPTPSVTASIYSQSGSAREHEYIEVNHGDLHRPRIGAATSAAQSHNVHALPQSMVGGVSGQAGPSLPDNSQGRKQDCSVADLLERMRKLEESSASLAGNRSSDCPPQVVMNKPRDLGKSQWMGKANEFSVIVACYCEMIGKDSKNASFKGPGIAPLLAQAGELIQKCKNAAKIIKLNRPSRSHASSLEVGPPSRVVSDAMVNLYFASFESTHRILHGPTFRADYQRYWDSPESATVELRLKILMVIGLGSSLHDHQSTDNALDNADLVRQWIHAAQNWLSGPLEKDRLSINGLQIYCLTILARQIFSVGGDLVWISTGSLVQRAMQMGLNREPKHLPGITPLQAEIRRRLWATILEIVVQSSLDSWMPPRITLDEFDVEPPSNVNDEDLNDSTTVTQPLPRSTFTETSIQLALLESLPVRLRIVQHLNNLHSEPSYPRVLELSAELNRALQACASSTSKHDNSEHYTPFRRNQLDYLVRRFTIPLHVSHSSRARDNPSYNYSRAASLDAALAIMSPEPDDARLFARLMASGGGMFREGLRGALTAVALELLARAEAQRLDGTLGRARGHLDVLKAAARDLVALSEERVRLGETNVKAHMFLCMTLAQVEAVEAGVPVELRVARGARDSLELCYGILRARTENISSLPSPDGAGPVAAGLDGYQGHESYNMYGMGMDFDWDSIVSDHCVCDPPNMPQAALDMDRRDTTYGIFAFEGWYLIIQFFCK
ncbi:hypothetical protein diail_8174 [Diaporthe ilicicola]|nr:hypothetical protein diail_8174 [Diaporthe ilicicola]